MDRQLASIKHSKFNGVAFIDLKKAFDLIDHQILLKEEEEEEEEEEDDDDDDDDDDDSEEEEEEEEDVSIKQQCVQI